MAKTGGGVQASFRRSGGRGGNARFPGGRIRVSGLKPGDTVHRRGDNPLGGGGLVVTRVNSSSVSVASGMSRGRVSFGDLRGGFVRRQRGFIRIG